MSREKTEWAPRRALELRGAVAEGEVERGAVCLQRQRRGAAPWLLALASAALGACSAGPQGGDAGAEASQADLALGGEEAAAGEDAREENTADASADAAADAAAEPAEESGADAAMDAVADAVADAAMDAAADAVADVAMDALPESAMEAAAEAGPAGPTEFWVLRVGDGVASLSSAAAPVFLERRSVATGALLGTLAMPTVASGTQQPVVLSGTSASEGQLAASGDGHFVLFAGYAAAPGTASLAGSTVPRVVARIDPARVVDTSTRFDGTFSLSTVTGAASDGTFYAYVSASASSGNPSLASRGFGSSAAPTTILTAPSNVRALGYFGRALYGTSSAAGSYLFEVGSLPTRMTTPRALLGLPSMAGWSPCGFAMLDLVPARGDPAVDYLYLADDRAVGSQGGVQVFLFGSDLGWHLNAIFDTGAAGARAVAATNVGSTNTVLAVTADGRVLRFDDDRMNRSPTATLLATAPPNTAYRGVVFAPQ